MHGLAPHSLKTPSILPSHSFPSTPSRKPASSLLILKFGYGQYVEHFVRTAQTVLLHSCYTRPSLYCYYHKNKSKKLRNVRVRASGRESPYDVLGVPPSASTKDIKRAYRRLALKYHPDVNKEAGAQEKFMRIKHAYNSLLNSKSRGKYDTGNQGSDFSYSTNGRYQTNTGEAEEEFYGFEDFFRDLQDEFRNWEASATAQGKPKSLWEELADIGEEFVEFLEKELNISDAEVVEDSEERSSKGYASKATNESVSDDEKRTDKGSINDNIDEIEAALAQLKRELGL